MLNQGHSKREKWKQRFRGTGVSHGTQGHTLARSLQRPEAGRLWGTQTVSFSAIHALCPCPHSSPSSAHPGFYPSDTPRLFMCSHHEGGSLRCLAHASSGPVLSTACLNTCPSQFQFAVKGPGVGRKGSLGRLTTGSVSSTYLCDCARAGLWERAQWAQPTPLEVPGALTLRRLILSPCSL